MLWVIIGFAVVVVVVVVVVMAECHREAAVYALKKGMSRNTIARNFIVSD